MAPNDFDYNQIPPGYYDLVAHEGKGIRRYWHQYKFTYVSESIKQSNPSDSEASLRVVDIGCGPGTFLGYLEKTCNIVGFGVDIANPQIEYANKRYGNKNLKFACVSSEDAICVEQIKKADVVTLIEVIEHLHLKDVQKTLSLLFKNMQPEAQLYITTPNYLSYWPALEPLVNILSEVNYEEQHITRLNRRRLTSLLTASGFSNIQVRSFLHVSPFAVGLLGTGLASFTRRLENKFLTHGGPLLCARAIR